MTIYEDTNKQKAFELYFEGYKLGLGVENTSQLDKDVAQHRFERYLERNRDSR